MKLLLLHSDYIEVEVKQKAIDDADDIFENFMRIEEPLVVFTSIEKEDTEEHIKKAINDIVDIKNKVNAQRIVIYPYVHLTNNPADPKKAKEFLNKLYDGLKSLGVEVYKAPFGWYKSFNIKVKGHPLAELSRTIGKDVEIVKSNKEKEKDLKQEKTHIDYADELEIIVKHERYIQKLGKRFGDLLGKGIQLHSIGGGIYRKILFDILRDFHSQRGYYLVETPIISNSELYNVSGHLKYYRENMYLFKIEDHEFAIKPMNCPHHILIATNLVEKYRKLPLPFRVFEMGRVHRYEPSGSVYGLLRVRGFTQDDAHIFVKPSDVKNEMLKVFEEMKTIYENIFHINISGESIKLRLSFYDPNELGKYYAGTKEEWEEIQEFMRSVAEELNKKYGIEYYEGIGEAVFYGPKLDFVANLGQEWQVGTIQFDFNLPRRFKIVNLFKEYLGVDQVYMVHRALLGSVERFLGSYLEFRKGRLPFTLNPVQVAIINILTGDSALDSKILDKSEEIYKELRDNNIRVVKIDSTKTSLGNTIRNLESRVKPSVYVYIGKKEVENDNLSIKYFDIKEMKHKQTNELWNTIERLEEPIYSITGKKYRLFEDLQFLV